MVQSIEKLGTLACVDEDDDDDDDDDDAECSLSENAVMRVFKRCT